LHLRIRNKESNLELLESSSFMFSFFHLSSILLRIFLKRAKNRYFRDVFFTTILLNASSFLQKKIQISIFLISIEQFLENRETGLTVFSQKPNGLLLVLSSLVLP
jgi:Ni,Fe-hydrogenase I cytochrome b subunit